MPKVKEVVKNPLERFREHFSEIACPAGGLPTMPTAISSTSSAKLGDMIARYSAWREYTEDRHMEACAVFAQCKSEYDLACNKAMLKADGATVTEKKAKAKFGDSDIEPLYRALNKAEIFRDLLANKLDSFSNVLAMLSRELTRRGVENM